ncbi:MAG: helix-turn-helix transcriptional regulator [Eubacterium sp.]|nr:helix-turn-helix transcriptional regulator [Eubacterium sp.]
MTPIFLSVESRATGRRIMALMHRRGLSVRDLADACGFEKPQAVYKWLNGQSLPSLENLVILSRVLGTSIENILVISGGDAAFFGKAPFFLFPRRRSIV